MSCKLGMDSFVTAAVFTPCSVSLYSLHVIPLISPVLLPHVSSNINQTEIAREIGGGLQITDLPRVADALLSSRLAGALNILTARPYSPSSQDRDSVTACQQSVCPLRPVQWCTDCRLILDVTNDEGARLRDTPLSFPPPPDWRWWIAFKYLGINLKNKLSFDDHTRDI